MKVLDLGCGPDGRSFSDFAEPSWEITGIDLREPRSVRHAHPRFRYVQTNAANLRAFTDKSFDLIISVGVIEHITGDDYVAMCREVQRVGQQWIHIVPWRWAWLEPHFRMPFFGAWPKWAQHVFVGLGMHKLLRRGVGRMTPAQFDRCMIWRSKTEYLRDFPASRVKLLMPTLEMMAVIHAQ